MIPASRILFSSRMDLKWNYLRISAILRIGYFVRRGLGMIFEYGLSAAREDFYNITRQIREAVAKSAVKDGIAVIFCPHTTAGITINENADPDVTRDLLIGLNKVSPNNPEYRHVEENSPAHLKASLTGSGVTVIIDGGRLVLGTWQGIYFCEFDPPRTRKFFVKVIGV